MFTNSANFPHMAKAIESAGIAPARGQRTVGLPKGLRGRAPIELAVGDADRSIAVHGIYGEMHEPGQASIHDTHTVLA
ncbi:MAG: hypothetical protein ACOCRN_04580 [Spirochaetia bacterium]